VSFTVFNLRPNVDRPSVRNYYGIEPLASDVHISIGFEKTWWTRANRPALFGLVYDTSANYVANKGAERSAELDII
jgi:hypothetical protein